jgi:hypothetical protein
MVKPIHLAAVAIAICAHWASADAQIVYRCGASYSNQPCAGASTVLADDPRSASQRVQNEAATKRDARLAAVMEKERVRQESEPAQATIPPQHVEAAEPVAPRPVAKRKSRPTKTELFTAVEPRKAGDAAAKKSKARKPAKTTET